MTEKVKGTAINGGNSHRATLGLIASHAARLKRSAKRYSLCFEDAEDAYQNALEILMTKAPSSDGDELLPWMHTVIKHEAIAIRMKRERHLEIIEEEGQATSPQVFEPPEQSHQRERIIQAVEAMHKLKKQELECLLLKLRGFSYSEIAVRTGYSWTKVNRCISEGRGSFMRQLNSIELGMNCDEMAPLLEALAQGRLGQDDRLGLRCHLVGCGPCRAHLRNMRTAERELAEFVPLLLGALKLHASDYGGGPFARVYGRIYDGLASLVEKLAGLGFKAQQAVDVVSGHKLAAVAAIGAVGASGGIAIDSINQRDGRGQSNKPEQAASSATPNKSNPAPGLAQGASQGSNPANASNTSAREHESNFGAHSAKAQPKRYEFSPKAPLSKSTEGTGHRPASDSSMQSHVGVDISTAPSGTARKASYKSEFSP